MHEKNPSRIWLLAALLLVLPLLYVLSIGPVWSYYQGRETPEWVYVVYTPITWLVNHSQAANGWLDWYLQFWLEAP